jgi:hypothetical protein
MIRRFAVALGSFAVAGVALALAGAAGGCFPAYEFHVPEAGPDTGPDALDGDAAEGDAVDAADAS